jgi:single-stranded DNA-binding protein
MSRDANLVLLVGRLAGPIERRRHPIAGVDSARFEVSVRSPGPPPRVDVLPVVWWDPPAGFENLAAGSVVQVVAGVRRRFWATENGRTSRLDLVAGHVEPRVPESRS